MDELRFVKHLLELKQLILHNQNELLSIKSKIETMHPEFPEITRKQASIVLNCSIHKIDKMRRAGMIEANSTGLLKYHTVVKHKKNVPEFVP